MISKIRGKPGEKSNPANAKAQMTKLLKEHLRLCLQQTLEFKELIKVSGKINSTTPDNVAKAIIKSLKIQFFEPSQYKVGQIFLLFDQRSIIDGVILALDQATYATVKGRLGGSDGKLRWLKDIIDMDDSLVADVLFDYVKGEARNFSWFTMGSKANKCDFLKSLLSDAFNNFSEDISGLVNE